MKQYSEEEALDLILKAVEPRVGKRAKMKRSLVYMKTELGATWIPVETLDEEESK